eukprot:2958858-Amphidinium_carterae.1
MLSLQAHVLTNGHQKHWDANTQKQQDSTQLPQLAFTDCATLVVHGACTCAWLSSVSLVLAQELRLSLSLLSHGNFCLLEAAVGMLQLAHNCRSFARRRRRNARKTLTCARATECTKCETTPLKPMWLCHAIFGLGPQREYNTHTENRCPVCSQRQEELSVSSGAITNI